MGWAAASRKPETQLPPTQLSQQRANKSWRLHVDGNPGTAAAHTAVFCGKQGAPYLKAVETPPVTSRLYFKQLEKELLKMQYY